MIFKIQANLRLTSPCHTGASDKSGNVALFNKRPTLLKEPRIIISRFPSEEARERAFEIFSFLMYRSVPKKLKTRDNDFYYQKLFHNMEVALSGTTSKKQFLSKLLKACQIHKLFPSTREVLFQIVERFELAEIRFLIREEGQFFQVTLQDLVQEQGKTWGQINELAETFDDPDAKKAFKETELENAKPINVFAKDLAWFQEASDNPPTIREIEVEIPEISGNSFKNRMRYVLAEDFVQRITKEQDGLYFQFVQKERKEFDINTFHQIFSGGNITDSGNSMSLEEREAMFSICPPLRLGYASGNQTVNSIVGTNFGRLRCAENGNGNLSCFDFFDSYFKTRNDTAKIQQQYNISGEHKGKANQQMIVFIEVLKAGTEIETAFELKPSDEITHSMFFHGLRLMAKFIKIGGMGNIGLGDADWKFKVDEDFEFQGITIKANTDFDIPEEFSKPYLDYVESIKHKALENLMVQVTEDEIKRKADAVNALLEKKRKERAKTHA